MSAGRVLIVDEEPPIRRALRAALTTQGYEVHDAASGEEALDHFRKSRFDLVLLDLNMPGMSGLDTCRSIRATSDTPIICLTVSDSEQAKVSVLDAGADDYVTKPFGVQELLARVRAVLRRLPPSSDRVHAMKLGSLEIDFQFRRIVSGGREI